LYSERLTNEILRVKGDLRQGVCSPHDVSSVHYRSVLDLLQTHISSTLSQESSEPYL